MNFDLLCAYLREKVSKIWILQRKYRIISLFYGESRSLASYYGHLNIPIYVSDAGNPIKQLTSLLPYYSCPTPGNQ